MKIVIDIPEEDYKTILNSKLPYNGEPPMSLVWVIQNGQVLPNGEWILQYRGCGDEFYLCSNCNEGRAIVGEDYKLSDFNFCPNCGARMQNHIKQAENNLTEKEVMIL